MSIIGKAIAQAIKTVKTEVTKDEKPAPKPKRNPKPASTGVVENGGSAGEIKVTTTSSTSGDKPATEASTSTVSRAAEFAIGDIDFTAAPDAEERQVGPGDPPSSFEVGDLDYYLEREADFEARHPDLEPPDYYTEYGDRYINEFALSLHDALPISASPRTRKRSTCWSKTPMRCVSSLSTPTPMPIWMPVLPICLPKIFSKLQALRPSKTSLATLPSAKPWKWASRRWSKTRL